jgi:hypothetical protein
MLDAGVALYADGRDNFTAARVKRIDDPNLNRRTSGSMTRLRAASARRIWRSRSATWRHSTVTRCGSLPPPIW